MLITNSPVRTNRPAASASISPASAGLSPSAAQPQAASSGDSADINWSGSKPAHRDVKKMTRGIAAAVGAAGLAKIAYDLASAPTIGSGLVNAGISLLGTSAALVAVDLGSGLAHHAGDNYRGNAGQLKHTKWHTEPDTAEYCMVGFSNKALDAVGFWPKWEKAVYQTTGKEPVAWQVPEYKAYCLGQLDKESLHAAQRAAGMPLT